MPSGPSVPANLQKLVLENVSDIIITTDLQFTVQSWNHIAEEFYCIPAEEAVGKSMGELVQFVFYGTTIEQAVVDLRTNKLWQGEVSFTNRCNKTFFFLQTIKYILDEEGNEVGILAVGRNITERKKVEEQLAESERFYRTLIADALDVTLLLNDSGEITFATPAVTRLLGYEVEEILHSNAFQYIHPEDLAWTIQSFEREVEENPEIKFIIVRILKKNGDWLWCMVRGHNLLTNPSVNAIVVYIHDDTPRKLATEALKESEKRFRNLVRDLQIGVLLQDAEGRILMTNNAMLRMFDLTEEQIIGGLIWEMFDDVIHEDGRKFLLNERPTYKAIQTKELVKDVVMGVWHRGRKERIWIITNVDPVLDANGRILNVVCSFTDITERKKLEKKSFAERIAYQRQLSQATIDGQEKERLEIGKELHDNIGQQLTTIKLQLDYMKAIVSEQAHPIIDVTLKGVGDIIDEVRAISRSLVPPTLKDLGFIDSVNDLVESFRRTQALKIELDYFDFDEHRLPDNKKLALFRIIQEQMNNIIKHANANHVSIKLGFADKQVMLRIKDNGSGFELNKIRRGLGLSNIINRAELFGGSVEIVTLPGDGCDLKVFIPCNVVSSMAE